MKTWGQACAVGGLLVSALLVCGPAVDGAPVGWEASGLLDGPVRVPDDAALLGQIEDALDFRKREDYDILLDAWEPGELLSHAQLTQNILDSTPHGLDALFVVGDELFEYAFRPEDGLGNGLGPGGASPLVGVGQRPNMRRVHAGRFGGPDAYSCASCHFLGGPDGAGTRTQNAFFFSDGDSTTASEERNPPHVLGLGPVEALAAEMTAELHRLRDQAVASARANQVPTQVDLVAKEVRFGTLVAQPDGTLDSSGVEGVDPDLVVRPFGWKGHQATIRGMAEESFRIHMGIVSTRTQELIREGLLAPEAFGSGVWYDIDNDGVSVELDEGMLTTIVTYLALLEVPTLRPPHSPRLQEAFAEGRGHFEAVGCATCHRPSLLLYDPIVSTGPREGPFVEIDVARNGEAPGPEPLDAQESAFVVHLFSDLRRHAMGPELASRTGQSSIPASHFLTRSLWGLADTGPYLHDGRAPTVHDAIIAHGGEASQARDRYATLSQAEQGALQVFLLSLTRQPRVSVP